MDKYYYKAIISYKGTNYSGWQFQTVNKQTVQEYVEDVLRKIANFQNFQVIAASRTDSGVHASAQVLKITLPRDITPKNIKMGMNTKLPQDIRVLSIERSNKSFNVNQDVISKEYHYYFACSDKPIASLNEIIYFCHDHLDLKLMTQACKLFIGTHNFSSFCVKGSRELNMERTITECFIKETSFGPSNLPIYFLEIKSSGFLKYMVRLIMAALFEVGRKNIDLQDLKKELSYTVECKRKKAPAHGLHLINIEYSDD